MGQAPTETVGQILIFQGQVLREEELFDKEAFATWLSKQPPGRYFKVRVCSSCIFAAYLTNKIGTHVVVGMGRTHIGVGRPQTYQLDNPDWLITFIEKVDSITNPIIYPGQALELLRKVA
jgi:hypothetical protein